MASSNLPHYLPEDGSFFRRHAGWGRFWKIIAGIAMLPGAVWACVAILTNQQMSQYIPLFMVGFSIIISLSLLSLVVHYFLDLRKQNKMLQTIIEFQEEEIEILLSPMPQIAQEKYRVLSNKFKKMAAGNVVFFSCYFLKELKEELPEFFLNIE